MAIRSAAGTIAGPATVFLLLFTLVWPQDGPAAAVGNHTVGTSAVTGDDFVHKIWTISTTVLEKHIEPPTRQEMVLGAIRGLLKAVGQVAPQELSRRVSALAAEDEIRQSLFEAWRQARAGDVADAKLEAAAIDGLLGVVPGSPEYLPAKEYAVREQLRANRYVGIGIALATEPDGGLPFVAEAFPRGPLRRAGGQDGDRILSVDGRSTAGLKLSEVVDLLRGAEGTRVTVEVRAPDAGESRNLEIVRGIVPLETVRGFRRMGDEWDYRVDPALPIGYLRLYPINPSTLLELRDAARRMHAAGIRALVIDFRTESSGNVHHAAIVADALLAGGKIGRFRRLEGVREYEADGDHQFSGWPMAVLVNRITGTEAEWLTAALQDNRRAIVVGEKTLGNAYVTEMAPLPHGLGAITLHVGTLERGDGRALLSSRSAAPFAGVAPPAEAEAQQDGGVVPDHPVPVRVETRAAAPVPTELAADRPKKLPTRAEGERRRADRMAAEDDCLKKALDLLRESLDR